MFKVKWLFYLLPSWIATKQNILQDQNNFCHNQWEVFNYGKKNLKNKLFSFLFSLNGLSISVSMSRRIFCSFIFFLMETVILRVSELFFSSYLPNPSARVGYDTWSIFKRSLTGLKSEFFFSSTCCLTCELHDSYFRLMTIKHAIPNIEWAIELLYNSV